MANKELREPDLEAAQSRIADEAHIEAGPKRSRSPVTLAKRAATAAATRYSLVFVWIAMAVVFAILTPEIFLSRGTFTTIFGSQSTLVAVTLALVIVLTVGEFDLSVASVLGLSASIVAALNVNHGWSIGWAILIALAAGALVGGINGFLVVKVGVDAIVETLGMATLLLGVATWITASTTISGVDNTLVKLVSDRLGDLPYSFYYGVALATVLWYVLSHTPLGRTLTFVGQGREVARLAGVQVDRIRWGAFVTSGVLSAWAGVISVGTLGAFESSIGPSYLLPAFTAVFLGATVVNPGRFNSWGSLIAIYFVVTGVTGLGLLGYSGWTEQVFYGSALVVAATVGIVMRRRVVAAS